MYFDSHAHFDLLEGTKADAVIARAVDVGVGRILAVGSSGPANEVAVNLAAKFPECVCAAVGYDRNRAAEDYSIPDLEALIVRARPVAIGEIGLDFHYHPETATAQETLLERMLEIARTHRLPAVIHSREAEAATLNHLQRHVAGWTGREGGAAVIHCFTGNAAFARKVVDLGVYVSFSGIVTFKNAEDLREALRLVPDDRLLIETDTPYLAPAPYRGQPNEPAFLPHVAAAVAQVRACGLGHIAEITTANAQRLFAI